LWAGFKTNPHPNSGDLILTGLAACVRGNSAQR
jgi:hypothetical protein